MAFPVINNTVNTATEQIEVTHGLTAAGTLAQVQPVSVYNSGGAAPTGITANLNYYAFVVDSTHLSLHTSRQGGLDGVSNIVNLTANGSGTNTLMILLGAEDATGLTSMPDLAPRSVLRGYSLCDSALFLNTMGGRDNAQGDPAQPSLRMDARGVFRFRWAFASGARTVSVNVKQEANASPRPTLVVKANPAIGIPSDVVETAGSSTNWITIGPANISPSADGATWVELHANYDGQYRGAPCYWDHIETT